MSPRREAERDLDRGARRARKTASLSPTWGLALFAAPVFFGFVFLSEDRSGSAQEAFTPIVITTSPLLAAGVPPPPLPEVVPFVPVIINTDALAATGVPPPPMPEAEPFSPLTIKTPTLTVTGKGGAR